MSSEQTDESGDPSAPVPSDDAKTSGKGAGQRSFSVAEASGYSTVLIVIGLISGVIDPPGNLFLAGVGALFALLYYFWRHQRPRARHALVIFIAVALGFFIGYFGRPMIHSAWGHLTGECDDPVELTVLLPVDGALGFETAIEHFNEGYVDGAKCKQANVTAYAAPWPDVQRALKLGWEANEGHEDDELAGFAPQRDVGPRPDLWLTESAAQVELAEASLDAAGSDDVLDADTAEPIGWTPLVVAVSDELFDEEFGEGDQTLDESLPDLVQLGDLHETPVVRSDPGLSPTALMFLEFLYGDDAEAVQMEKRLARSAQDAGLGIPGTDTDLFCKLSEASSDPAAAILTTERALSRYNSGAPLGDDCPFDPESRPGYAPLYLEGLGDLHYRAARLHWDDDPWAAERSAVAEDLSDWLANGDEERWSPETVGIRSNDHDGGHIDGSRYFVLSRTQSDERFTGDEFNELLISYSMSRVPTNVLLAIDGSLSMGTQIGGEGSSRFELAVEGVRAALGNLGPHDAAGLWTFPAEGGDAYDVLTDGADRDASDVGAVVDRIDASEVSLYIIAVGDASCRAANFADMTASPRISCLETEEGQIKTTFDGLFGQLWS